MPSPRNPAPAPARAKKPNTKVPGKRETVALPGGGRTVAKTDIGELTPKQQMLSDEYLKDFNASRAGRVAGYSNANSANSALREPKVQAYIERAKKERIERTKLSADEVLVKLARMVRADYRNLLNKEGQPTNPRDLDDDTASVLHTFETSEYMGKVTRKVKGVDPAATLQLAMRHFGLLNDKLQLNTGPVLVYDMARLATLTTEELRQLDIITAKLEAVVVPGQGKDAQG